MVCSTCHGNVALQRHGLLADLPSSCYPDKELYRIIDPPPAACAVRVCNDTGDGWVCLQTGSPGSIPTLNIPDNRGLYVDSNNPAGSLGFLLDADAILHQRHDCVPLAVSTALTGQSCISATVGSGGITLTLPCSESNNFGDTELSIVDTGVGNLTLAACGNDSINGVTTSYNVSGFLSGYRVRALCRGDSCATNYLVEVAEPSFTLPTGPGLAPATAGRLEFNTTQQALKGGGSGISGAYPRVLSVTRPNQTLTNSTTAEQDYASVFTIPANFLIAQKVVRITALIQYVSDSAPATQSHYLDLGATRVAEPQSASTPATSVTRTMAIVWTLVGTATPGASVGINVSMTAPYAAFNGQNAIGQPVAVATNGTLTVIPGVTFGTAGGGESSTLLSIIIEELN